MTGEPGVVVESPSDATAGVSLVVHRRLAPEHYAEYETWQREVGDRLATWPGFLSRDVLRPDPPHQVDWVIIQHFTDATAARAWLQSDERAALMARIAPILVGNDDVHLFTEEVRHAAQAASAIISSRVRPEDEKDFLAWQRAISTAESRFDGFLGHRIERPVPGVQEDWVVVLSFDTDEHLSRWVDSPERATLLEQGSRFTQDLSVTKASYGFGFWSGSEAKDPIFKSNLLVLLMLYPTVFLWGYFIADPLFAAQGVPFWLSLFIGNVVSTQLLGFFFVPWAFRRFRWWLRRNRTPKVHFYGYAILVAFYLASMALYAWLLSLRG